MYVCTYIRTYECGGSIYRNPWQLIMDRAKILENDFAATAQWRQRRRRLAGRQTAVSRVSSLVRLAN